MDKNNEKDTAKKLEEIIKNKTDENNVLHDLLKKLQKEEKDMENDSRK